MGLTPATKILLSILTGLLVTASFPPAGTDWLIWISFLPLFAALEDTPPAASFRLGLLAGLAHYASLLYWIINVISTYGGLNIFVSSFVLLLLCLYLSLYMGIFSWLLVRFRNSGIKILFFAGAWISLEYARATLFTGFPWGLLGYTQYSRLALVQTADITGIYGISFLIAAVNVFFFQLIVNGKDILKNRYFLPETIILFILLVSSIYYGNMRLKEYSSEETGSSQANVAIVQGNIDQTLKWDEEFQAATLDIYSDLSRSSFNTDPDIIIWPETAVPLFFQDENCLSESINSLAKESGGYLVFGSPAYTKINGTYSYYNRAWSITPEGTVNGQYDKNHLVPFGEYVPLKKFLPFVHRLVPSAGDFARGDSKDPIKLGKTESGILICYEVIFPEIAGAQTLNGADILINITNDAWFGITSAPYQHLYISVFRAIETRRPLIRSANTGISAIVDRAGKIIKHGDLFTEEVITGKVAADNDLITFYSRRGNIFTVVILILCLIKISIGLCYPEYKRK